MPDDSIEPVSYWDTAEKLRLILKYGFQCYYCGAPFSISAEGWDSASIDQWNTQARGGEQDFGKLRLACTSCNSAKGKRALTDEELESFRARRKALRQQAESWVHMTIPFLERLRAQRGAWPDHEELGAQLIEALRTLGPFTDVSRYRRTRATWVEFKDHGRLWYAQTDWFMLQPYFAHEAASKEPKATLDAMLAEHGYVLDMHCKYIMPFAHAAEGAQIVKAEVDAFNAAYERLAGA